MRYLIALFAAATLANQALADINVYTSRKEHLVEPVFKIYEKKTGTKINYLTDKELPLIKRIKAESRSPKADILLTVDAGNLWLAAKEGILEPFPSKELQKNIPSHLRDEDNRWYGLSVRARTIVYSKARVKPSELSTYEDLADPKWKNRLCLRTSKKVYNQSLVAMMIANLGKKKTESVVAGWVKNLATNVFSDDTRLLEAIAAGQCDVGIVNTYYLGRLLKQKADFPVAVFWPNQKDLGVHVNVSGGGIIKGSKNKKEAQKFLDWLSQSEAQELFAKLNLEFPANPKVKSDPLVAAWGDFKPNVINVAKAGELQAEAVLLMDRVGYK